MDSSTATVPPNRVSASTRRHIAFALGKTQVKMLQIEWKSSHYHSDGRQRSRPKASTVHGWLVKWRATFSGNERLRKEGIREMREAKAVRERKKQRKQRRAARQAKAGVSKSFFRPWPTSLGKGCTPQTPKGQSRIAQPSSAVCPGRKITRQLAFPTHSPSPTPNGRRSSHNHQEAGDHPPHNSPKASHKGRGDTVRTVEKNR